MPRSAGRQPTVGIAQTRLPRARRLAGTCDVDTAHASLWLHASLNGFARGPCPRSLPGAPGYANCVEHLERQEERENEIKSDVDDLEQGGDELERRGEELDQKIGETRDEFENKQRAEDVPGAQEEGIHAHGSAPPPEADATPGDSE